MANVKITQLPSATTPLTGTEVFPLVQGTTTKQVAITGLFTSPVMTNPTLGTVGQADLINATGLPIASGVSGLGAGIATFLGTPSSANLRTAVTDETGTGALVFANAPVLVAPDLGTPSVLVATNATGTAVGLTAGSAITNANLTGAVTSVGNATSLGSFTSAQLRTALTDETGAGVAVFATSPTITAPILNQINDTNNAQILGLSPTTSAVDYLVVKNGIGVGVPLHFYADGSSANIGLHIQPKGTGLVTISDGTDFNKGIRFRSSSSAASAITLLDAVSTAGRVVTLPDATTTLVGRDTTDTLTNKTIAFSSNTFSGTLAIANGGTNASTAASAIENLLPAYAGNGSKGLRLNSGATALEWVADGGGTVTSVGGTGTVNGITLTGTVTTSGNLTLGGTLSGVSLTTQVTGILPTANGGTNLGGATPFTSGGVVYASSTSALATGSALTFDGASLRLANAVGTTANGLRLDGGAQAHYWYLADNTSSVFEIGSSAGNWRWSNSGGEAMRLTSTGLGIGTSSPTQKLQVAGNVAIADGGWFGFGDVNERIVGNNAGYLQFYTDGTETMRLTSTGLGIKTTSPSYPLDIGTSQSAETIARVLNSSTNASAAAFFRADNNTSVLDVGIRSTGASAFGALDANSAYLAYNGSASLVLFASNASSVIKFVTGGTAERARINNSGNFLINTTSVFSNAKLTVSSTATDGIASTQGTTGGYCFLSNALTNGGTFYHASFKENDTQRGSITSNGTVTVYNTTSDYRLKNNQAPLTGSGAFIDALQPKTWNWAQDGSKGVGFIAHEFAEVSPSSVTGAKDAIDAEGNPVHQVMQASSAEVIANLVAEIQSLRQRVAQLETN